MTVIAMYDSSHASLPTRGAWIEIITTDDLLPEPMVAPHTGSVD